MHLVIGAALEKKSVRDMAAGLNRLGGKDCFYSTINPNYRWLLDRMHLKHVHNADQEQNNLSTIHSFNVIYWMIAVVLIYFS